MATISFSDMFPRSRMHNTKNPRVVTITVDPKGSTMLTMRKLRINFPSIVFSCGSSWTRSTRPALRGTITVRRIITECFPSESTGTMAMFSMDLSASDRRTIAAFEEESDAILFRIALGMSSEGQSLLGSIIE